MECFKKQAFLIYIVNLLDKYNKKPLSALTLLFKKNQLDAQFFFSIFRQKPLHVSGVSTAHHQEVRRIGYNIWYLLLFLDDCLLCWLGWHCLLMMVYRYDRNM
jgi:hypothetical protein